MCHRSGLLLFSNINKFYLNFSYVLGRIFSHENDQNLNNVNKLPKKLTFKIHNGFDAYTKF